MESHTGWRCGRQGRRRRRGCQEAGLSSFVRGLRSRAAARHAVLSPSIAHMPALARSCAGLAGRGRRRQGQGRRRARGLEAGRAGQEGGVVGGQVGGRRGQARQRRRHLGAGQAPARRDGGAQGAAQGRVQERGARAFGNAVRCCPRMHGCMHRGAPSAVHDTLRLNAPHAPLRTTSSRAASRRRSRSWRATSRPRRPAPARSWTTCWPRWTTPARRRARTPRRRCARWRRAPTSSRRARRARHPRSRARCERARVRVCARAVRML